MQQLNYFISFFFFLFFTTSVSGQSFLSTNGQDIVNEEGETVLLRGMGLGGWMLQEGYMLQTASFANPQYQIRAKLKKYLEKQTPICFTKPG